MYGVGCRVARAENRNWKKEGRLAAQKGAATNARDGAKPTLCKERKGWGTRRGEIRKSNIGTELPGGPLQWAEREETGKWKARRAIGHMSDRRAVTSGEWLVARDEG